MTSTPAANSSATQLTKPTSSTITLTPRRPLPLPVRRSRRPAPISAVISTDRRSPAAPIAAPRRPLRYFLPDKPRKGADVLVEALEREGVTDVFAYPGSGSVEITHALLRSSAITNHLLRHEQGEAFAAEGYARSTGRPGVCITTTGPGATNLVTGLADALLDSVPRSMIGTDALQESPIVEITRPITKHNYLVLSAGDIPRVIKEAFVLATSGRPGPVLVDIPKDVQQQLVVPNWNLPLQIDAYLSRLPNPPQRHLLEQVLRNISESRRPLIIVGGGCSGAAPELRRFADLTGIPVATTLMGIGVYPTAGELSLKMLGMHGTVYANYAADKCDLLLALGVRFDSRVTGKLEAFASRAKIVHIDIDSTEIGRIKNAHVSICSDVKPALAGMNELIESSGMDRRLDFRPWKEELEKQRKAYPLTYKELSHGWIPPQYAIQVLDELTNGEAIISTGVGQHQMLAAQYYTYKRPRQLLSSGGLGTMGFGLPAAAGAAVANPGKTVLDIDGDGSFLMNVQELATVKVEKLPVKMVVLNNQQLGMVAQLENQRHDPAAHTYLGDPENRKEVYPDLVAIARGFGIPAARVSRKKEVKEAMREMLETPGPYLLDVIVPQQEQVLPMIPSDGSFKDTTVSEDTEASKLHPSP
ncbi:Acetolactate synthase 1, chloroplastic [Apostasia shenzhenica]|uniref:Acetolactate synthase n=1 Tax=Apostasia shenzhenica TaxID=1088818 RepID=A0A2I0AZ71_9ASPA|nr:Acetolactate synthase 1, chloroplastic [Apostasia shenzhenica]